MEAPSTASEVITIELRWSRPLSISDIAALPECAGVYAFVIERDGGYGLARIGAARNLRARIAAYDKSLEHVEPQLRVLVAEVTPKVREALEVVVLANRPDDIGWLEYRLERLLLDAYELATGALPPGNFQRGSRRDYLARCQLRESGEIHVLILGAASLCAAVRELFRQSRAGGNETRPSAN